MDQDLREQFLRLAYVDMLPYATIAATLDVTRPQLSVWDKELQPLREPISALKALYNRKCHHNGFASFAAFYDWYQTLEQKCHYCGITPQQVEQLRAAGHLHTKRWATRGRRLELDRLDSEGSYSAANVVLCCYWCNNAKTDEFSAAAFAPIAAGIRQEWDRRLALLSTGPLL